MCGHTIGEYAMVAAGAVEPYMLVAGVPAKVVGKIDEEGNLR